MDSGKEASCRPKPIDISVLNLGDHWPGLAPPQREEAPSGACILSGPLPLPQVMWDTLTVGDRGLSGMT